MYCNKREYSVDVDINADFSEIFSKAGCVEKEIAGYSVYYLETAQCIQANFVYKNNFYAVHSDTEDNLFRIIETLNEIN